MLPLPPPSQKKNISSFSDLREWMIFTILHDNLYHLKIFLSWSSDNALKPEISLYMQMLWLKIWQKEKKTFA